MQECVNPTLYDEVPSTALVGIKKEIHTDASISIDAFLEMNIVRHMKAMKFRTFEEYRNYTAWIVEFGAGYDKCDITVVRLVGERV